MERTSSVNGSSHKHKHKDKDRKSKYVLDSNGNPKIGPDGKRIKIKKEHRSSKHDVSHGDRIPIKKENLDSENDFRPGTSAHGRGDNDSIRKLKKKLKKEKQDKEKHGKKRKASEIDSKADVKKSGRTKTEGSPAKKPKKEEDEKWKWWEERSSTDDGVKWKTLEHKGPMFAPDYEPLPSSVHFKYDGKTMKLSEPAEEAMTFYAKMLDHDYTSKEVFNKNFFGDWRKVWGLAVTLRVPNVWVIADLDN